MLASMMKPVSYLLATTITEMQKMRSSCSFLRQVPGQAIKHSSSALRRWGGSGPAADNTLSSGSATGRLLCSSQRLRSSKSGSVAFFIPSVRQGVYCTSS